VYASALPGEGRGGKYSINEAWILYHLY